MLRMYYSLFYAGVVIGCLVSLDRVTAFCVPAGAGTSSHRRIIFRAMINDDADVDPEPVNTDTGTMRMVDAEGENEEVIRLAERLRSQAARVRLEAELAESSFALEQIASLEERLKKAASSGNAVYANATSPETGLRSKIASYKKRLASKRETDWNSLVRTGPMAQYADFCNAVAETLAVGAPPGTCGFNEEVNEEVVSGSNLQEIAHEAGLSLQASAEVFANVVNCFVVELVDKAAAAEDAVGNEYNATDSVMNDVIDFAEHAASVFDSFTKDKGVTIEPVTYNGKVDETTLERMFTSYASEASATERRIGVCRELLNISDEKAEKAMRRTLLKEMNNTATNSSAEPRIDGELSAMMDELELEVQGLEEYVANRTLIDINDEDRKAIEQVKQITDLFGEALMQDEEIQKIRKDIKADKNFSNVLTVFNEALSGNITGEELEYVKMAASFIGGVNNLFNTSLADEIKLEMAEEKILDALSADDPSVREVNSWLNNAYPQTIIGRKNIPERKYVDHFVDDVLFASPSVFVPSSRRAQDVFSAYLMQGTNKMESGEALMAYLEEKIEDAGLKDKLRVFWVRIPNDITGEEMTEIEIADIVSEVEGNVVDKISTYFDAEMPPALLITGPQAAVSSQPKSVGPLPLLNTLGLASVLYFALSCFALNDDGSMVDSFQHPIGIMQLFGAILGLQALHEVGHYAAAAVAKVEVDYPVIISWPWTGLLGTKTELKSPPPNANALFDVSALGPIIGLFSSIAFLVAGLKLTLSVDQALLSDLPRLPLETLEKTSWLTSSIVESVVGFDVLSSLDATSSTVPCHPLAIAGYIGILANGFSFLPFSTQSDGGRMARAVAGNVIVVGFIYIIAVLFLLVQGIREWDTSKLLLSWLFLIENVFVGEEVPCINDADTTDGPRYAVFLLTTALAFVALSPAL